MRVMEYYEKKVEVVNVLESIKKISGSEVDATEIINYAISEYLKTPYNPGKTKKRKYGSKEKVVKGYVRIEKALIDDLIKVKKMYKEPKVSKTRIIDVAIYDVLTKAGASKELLESIKKGEAKISEYNHLKIEIEKKE